MVAIAIMFILLISLIGLFARGAAGFKNAQLVTLAQNVAEFQAEDLKAMLPSVLNGLVETNGRLDPNYPTNEKTSGYEYDSGERQTDYHIAGISKLVGSPYIAGFGCPTSPPVPTDSESGVLRGSNITVQAYSDTEPLPPYTIVGWYYDVVLHHEAYPLFTKQVEIVRYDAKSLPNKTDHNWYGGDRGMFDYTITIRYGRQAPRRVLYKTSGTISYAYSNVGSSVSMVSPNGGETWGRNSSHTVSWVVAGDATGIASFTLWISTDGGASYTSLGTAVGTARDTLVTMPGYASPTCLITVNALDAGVPTPTLLASDTCDDYFALP
jgi:type II secretory pathway pseudopilin PulG